MYDEENYYIFIKEYDDNKVIDEFIIRIFKKSAWNVESIKGLIPYDLENEIFDREDVIDDILEKLRDTYDYVQEISFSEVDDYMEED